MDPDRRHRLREWALTGFTLFVITLAAAAVVLVNTLGFLGGHNVDDTRIQIKKMEEAITVYASKHRGKFPSRLEDARKYFPDGEVPVDAWGNAFVYTMPDPVCGYRIVSLGADGAPGGEDADADIDACSLLEEWRHPRSTPVE